MYLVTLRALLLQGWLNGSLYASGSEDSANESNIKKFKGNFC